VSDQQTECAGCASTRRRLEALIEVLDNSPIPFLCGMVRHQVGIEVEQATADARDEHPVEPLDMGVKDAMVGGGV